jgi:Ca2+-dependent lipid-binding protein
MLLGLRRGSTGYFVRHAELLDLDLGSRPPTMQAARVVTRAADNEDLAIVRLAWPGTVVTLAA